ncbi:MAG: glycosyltransferase family 4 protein, partial [Dehalococcoidia bacterium]|nr:glycosyltransferase family 4 protein [Dehalococcoidia bacterium]
KALDHKIYRRLAAFIEGLIFGHDGSEVRIVVSQHDKDLFVRHYGAAVENITVIPNGVDLAVFNSTNKLLYRDPLRQKYGISRNVPILMFAGGDWERKGLRYIIEALSLIPRPDVKLLIVGSGDEKFYGQLAELKQVNERVIFISHRSNLWEYYASCDVFVQPTIYEAFGLTIIEAMASGLPIITSRSAGAADFITDGIDGLLLNDPTDINDLAAKIKLLLSNAKLRRAMGQCAQRTVEKLSWDRVAQKTLEVYNSVLERKKRST